jgi:RNA polymerase sigma-54 factor
MVMAPRLEQRLGQSLVMTPQLQQAIKLLQLSNMELSAFVESELEKNPLLERDDAPLADTPERAQQSEDGTEDAPAPDDLSLDNPADANVTDDFDADMSGQFEDGSITAGAGASIPADRGVDDSLPGLEETLSETISLRTHLNTQLGLAIDTPADAVIGACLIDSLDDAGYLTEPLDLIADGIGADVADVERVLGILQTFEPTGVFARDLAECLTLQLLEKDRFDPAMETFIANLDMVAAREFTQLAGLCGLDVEEIPDMLAEIRELDPKPGMSFTGDAADVVVPDVLMVPHPKGGWFIELNTDTLPRVLVNTTYHAHVQKQPMSAADKKYMAEQFQTANWLVRALHQRATTILKVSSEIARQQDAFFKKGVKFLKPLVLRDVADVIEMHESTVSRVTSNKYIHTPRGTFELKYFFTSSIAAKDGGEAFSAESVKARLKELVDLEEPKKILSDDKLVKILSDEGFDIARRTVAKYREALGIGSSVARRKAKAPPK